MDREGALSLTDTSSDTAAVSQVSSNKSRGKHRRARRKIASPRFPDEMSDPEAPRRATVSCRRPTNAVPRVVSVRQSIVASAICDASEHEPASCVSSRGVKKFNLSPPTVVRHRVCYIYTGCPVPPEEQSVTTVDEASLHQVHGIPSPCDQPQRAVYRPVGSV